MEFYRCVGKKVFQIVSRLIRVVVIARKFKKYVFNGAIIYRRLLYQLFNAIARNVNRRAAAGLAEIGFITKGYPIAYFCLGAYIQSCRNGVVGQ